ncbi:hypothetical protein [Sabulibacter ruber]|uniref:hypothetical protein n=1 Tax=Sabulibacter ruber TaxID=2811901 RepID=UPI001A96909E|nr:hypothetical protein [Sabulibacter ruber]
MKKLIFLLALPLIFCVSSHAQTATARENAEYCELTTDTKAFKAKARAFVDYGEGDEKLVDDRGKEVLFGSSVGALNHMQAKGWEVIDAYRKNGYTRYLLRRSH